MSAENQVSEEKIKALKKLMLEELAQKRQNLLMHFPFTGAVMMKLDIVPVRDKRNRTACTDGNSIYVDIDFWANLDDDEKLFVLAHETWHCIMLHFDRRQNRDPQIFNIATDMEVNSMLSKDGLKAPSMVVMPPKKLVGKSAEYDYEWLLKKYKKQLQQQGKDPGTMSAGSQATSGEDSDDGDDYSTRGSGYASGHAEDGVLPKDLNDPSNKKDGKKLSGQFDKHSYANDISESEDPNADKVTDRWGEVGYDKDFQPHVREDASERMREAAIGAAQTYQRMKGDLPSHLAGVISNLEKPEIDWKELLASFITLVFGGTRQWLPPSRRHVWNDVYLQSRRTEQLKCAVIVDTSGSCWGDLSKFFTELNALLKTFGSYTLNLIQCDAEVHSCKEYSDENPFPIDDPASVKFEGCGGSDFRPAVKFLQEKNIEHDVLIFFTDGEIDFPIYPPEKPAVIILTKGGNKNCCSWGQKIEFNHESATHGVW